MKKEHSKICLDRVLPEEAEVLLGLYVELFHEREPLTRYMSLSKERMKQIARAMHMGSATNPVSQGLCWFARDRDKAVGFIVCNDEAADANQQMPGNLTDQEQERLSAVMALLQELRKSGREPPGTTVGTCLHIAAVGIAPGYEGLGIAGRLLQEALTEAMDRGFSHVFSECTGTASVRCHEKAGFENLHGVSLNDFEISGTHPFLDSNMHVHLLWKELAKNT